MAASHSRNPSLELVLASHDRLERACVAGNLAQVKAAFEAGAPFVYASFALAAAANQGHTGVCRYLLAQQVDLLAPVAPSAAPGVLLPHEDRFTRFALTRASVNLLRHPFDPTLADVVFAPLKPSDALIGAPYDAHFDLQKACACIATLAADKCFDAASFNELTRAALVRGWHALRHQNEQDVACFETCFELVEYLLGLHAKGAGDARLDALIGQLVVPRTSEQVLYKLAQLAPEAFVQGAAQQLSWLQEDPQLMEGLICAVPTQATPDQTSAARLVLALAQVGLRRACLQALSWPKVESLVLLQQAVRAASEAGHAQLVAELVQRTAQQERLTPPDTDEWFLLRLGILLV